MHARILVHHHHIIQASFFKLSIFQIELRLERLSKAPSPRPSADPPSSRFSYMTSMGSLVDKVENIKCLSSTRVLTV